MQSANFSRVLDPSTSAAGIAALRWRPAAAAAADRDYDLADVARCLGIRHLAPRTVISTIRALVDQEGFPPPLTIRLLRGRRVNGGKAVTRRSHWRADLVDAWFDRDLPPAAALRREEAARARSDAVMAGRAQLLIAANG